MTNALPSWKDGPAREAILRFVRSVCGRRCTPRGGAHRRLRQRRHAVGGEARAEQLHFVIEQWRAEADADPSLKEREPYRAAVDRDDEWFRGAIERHHAGDDHDMDLVMDAILSTVSDRRVEEYHAEAAEFYRRGRHPTLDRPYERTVYRPMHELLRHLEDHGFPCYLVSGGDRDLMRPISAEYYGIPVDQVIGSAVGVAYDADANELGTAAGSRSSTTASEAGSDLRERGPPSHPRRRKLGRRPADAPLRDGRSSIARPAHPPR